ncbi:MAG: hypothetical protein WC849_01190 [Candidatus Paceibacterota bacterium]
MKIFKNILCFLGLVAYKNMGGFIFITVLLGFILMVFSLIIMEYFPSPYWYILFSFGIFLMIIFLVGVHYSNKKNYKVAIWEARKFRGELNSRGILITDKISEKISILFSKTLDSKNPGMLNSFIEKIRIYNRWKKELISLKKDLGDIPSRIEAIESSIKIFENSLH